MKTNVIVKFQFDGMHHWPGVVEHNDLKQVHFLQHLHRHMFHVTAKKEVSHDDRDIEIIMLKRNIIDYLHRRYYNSIERTHMLGSTSCEMLANELVKVFSLSYCEVLEDGENGAEVIMETKQLDTEVITSGSLKLEDIEFQVTYSPANTVMNTKNYDNINHTGNREYLFTFTNTDNNGKTN